jgi:NADPH:quinone reductase-like Zn-dependent oxidoreductase
MTAITTNKMMRAVAIKQFGSPATSLDFVAREVASPKGNEILVKIAYAGCNVIDCKIRAGKVPGMKVCSSAVPAVI